MTHDLKHTISSVTQTNIGQGTLTLELTTFTEPPWLVSQQIQARKIYQISPNKLQQVM